MPSHKRKLIDDATRRILADNDITDYTVDTTAGNHGRVTFSVDGKRATIIYPSTASDHRSLANHLAFMRRTIRRLRKPETLQAGVTARGNAWVLSI